MNRERLNSSLDAITDKKWGIFKVWTKDYEGSIYPEYITKEEAFLLKVVGRIMPEKAMPFIVRQWAGEDGEDEFKKRLSKYLKP